MRKGLLVQATWEVALASIGRTGAFDRRSDLEETEELRLKSYLACEIARGVEDRHLRQEDIVTMTGLTVRDVSKIIDGRPTDHSILRLMHALAALGKDVAIQITDTQGDAGSVYKVSR